MPEQLAREAFARTLNTQFQVQGNAAGALALELIEVSEVRLMPGSESFSIVFRGPLSTFLPQAFHRFNYDELGAFELFIVPIRRDDHGFYHEAVFNRMRQEGWA